MTYSELAYRMVSTICGTSDRLTRAELDEIDPAALEEVGSEIILATAHSAAQGAPPLNADQYSRAVVLRDWRRFRDGPVAMWIDGGMR